MQTLYSKFSENKNQRVSTLFFLKQIGVEKKDDRYGSNENDLRENTVTGYSKELAKNYKEMILDIIGQMNRNQEKPERIFREKQMSKREF